MYQDKKEIMIIPNLKQFFGGCDILHIPVKRHNAGVKLKSVGYGFFFRDLFDRRNPI
ncbi:MAG: hypothetical protein HUU54_16175 [Ignavibacteriaceae bacterium]|nr:hypothetical protein [Ignavibacteriaceae bacterium]